jgi:predicted transcriptional regulator
MRRQDMNIVTRLLEMLWREGSPMGRTRLQVVAGLDRDVFIKFLEWMLSKDLVSMIPGDDGHERILLTEKGMESYTKLVRWINEVVRGVHIP